jgi:hypothetical protein
MKPGSMPYLEGCPKSSLGPLMRKGLQEAYQSLLFIGKGRRNLEEEGTEFGFQTLCASQEPSKGLLRPIEPFDMGEKTACLDRETKPGRGLLPPGFKYVLFRQAIKAGVDLHGGEMLGIEREPLPGAKTLGIKDAISPVRIAPATGADEGPGHLSS